jgi:hypothetical protein
MAARRIESVGFCCDRNAASEDARWTAAGDGGATETIGMRGSIDSILA